MSGLRIKQVNVRGSDSRGEYVHIRNDGPFTVNLGGHKLSDYTTTQQEVHVYDFPGYVGSALARVAPGQSIFVFTGIGTNGLSTDGSWLLFMGRRASVWNNDGDVAYLRDSEGRFIHSITVGSPSRHPARY